MTPSFAAQATASEKAAAYLLGRANTGPSMLDHIREMAMAGQPEKRLVSSAAFTDMMSATRDLTAAKASGGGYLVPTGNLPLQAVMERYSIFNEAGVTRISGLEPSPLTMPRTVTVPTASWLSAEGVTIGASDPVFGQVAMTPKWAAATIKVSRQLMLQSQAEQVVGPLVAEAIARAIDTAILHGSGVNGQPQGLFNTTGIGTQSGSSLAAAGLRTMRKAVLDAGGREDRLSWIGATDVQEVLNSREFSAGSGRQLWDTDGILGRPAVASSMVAAGSLVVGDFSRVTVVLFDAAGLTLEFNPYSNFAAGQVSFRLLVPVDVAVSPAAAFSTSTSIT